MDEKITIPLQLTSLEARQLEEFLDMAVRAQGIAVARAAVDLQAKLLWAIDTAKANQARKVPCQV